MATKSSNELSYDTKTIIVVLTLLLFYPVGVILMFKWMDWARWLKILIGLPVILILLGILVTFIGAIVSTFSYQLT
jgi:hypothetical protein